MYISFSALEVGEFFIFCHRTNGWIDFEKPFEQIFKKYLILSNNIIYILSGILQYNIYLSHDFTYLKPHPLNLLSIILDQASNQEVHLIQNL